MFLNRNIFSILKENLQNKKLLILIGSRQVGKSSLMKMLEESLRGYGKSLYIDMDIISNREYARSLESFLDLLRLNGYDDDSNEKFFVFIDEFQTIANINNIFKNLYDNYPKIKVIASGSSSLSIKKGIRESLAGRKFIFEIYPLDFREYLVFQKDNAILDIYDNFPNLKSRSIIWPTKLKNHFNYFLSYGGYPEVSLAKTEQEKKQILASIFDLYLEKDIANFSGIENIFEFKKLVEILAVQNGQQLNFDSLAKESSLHNKTVRSYLHLLEETYLIKTIRPFYSNKKKEIVKAPKIYFLDNGVRNYFMKNYSNINLRTDRGAIFESYVMQELLKHGQNLEINYWRTKSGQEVDFIISFNDSMHKIPIEVKYSLKTTNAATRNLSAFLKRYNLDKGIVLSKNTKFQTLKDGKTIIFRPAVNFSHDLD